MNIIKAAQRLINIDNFPSYVIFFVTASCNASCPMCFYAHSVRSKDRTVPELTIEEYEKIALSMKPCSVIGISGGEPFMRDDLADIVSALAKRAVPLTFDIPTNGFFTERIIKSAEIMAKANPDIVIDIQLSLDGPEDLHNTIRGIKEGYKRLKETYKGLCLLRSRYSNLKIKICSVFSALNQDHIEGLFIALQKDFPEIDRFVFSVAHGTTGDKRCEEFSWHRYFEYCGQIPPIGHRDTHSVFTKALRKVKNDYLQKILKEGDFYKSCRAGKIAIAIDEIGRVFPCEPLWHPVADLRQNGYSITSALTSKEMDDFQRMIIDKRCNCHWNIPIIINILRQPVTYPRLIIEMVRVMFGSSHKELLTKWVP